MFLPKVKFLGSRGRLQRASCLIHLCFFIQPHREQQLGYVRLSCLLPSKISLEAKALKYRKGVLSQPRLPLPFPLKKIEALATSKAPVSVIKGSRCLLYPLPFLSCAWMAVSTNMNLTGSDYTILVVFISILKVKVS